MDKQSQLARNRGILENIRRQLADFQDESKPMPSWAMGLFPGQPESAVRERMIAAKQADIANYEHIIAQYESGNV